MKGIAMFGSAVVTAAYLGWLANLTFFTPIHEISWGFVIAMAVLVAIVDALLLRIDCKL